MAAGLTATGQTLTQRPMAAAECVSPTVISSEIPLPSAPQSCGIRYIRVAFHFMLDANGSGNFNEVGSNQPKNGTTLVNQNDPSQGYFPSFPQINGYQLAEAIVDTANIRLARNPVQAYNQNGVTTFMTNVPQQPKQWRFVLAGVYFRRTSNLELQWQNSTGATVNGITNNCMSTANNDQFGVNRDSVINVFMENAALNRNINTPNLYNKTGGNAGAFGFVAGKGFVKMVGQWNNWGTQNFWTPAELLHLVGNLLCHEVGHLQNLFHVCDGGANQINGCTDVPPALSGWDVTNNMMDPNWTATAVSPCQQGTVSAMMNTLSGQRYIYSCGCPRPNAFATLPASACLNAPIVLDGRASYGENYYKIMIEKQTSGVWAVVSQITLSGKIGQVDLKSFYSGFVAGTYRVTLTTHVSLSCTNSRKVVLPLEVVTNPLTCLPQRPGPPSPASGGLNAPLQLRATPNPATDAVTLTYYAAAPGAARVRVYRVTGELVVDLPTTATAEGWQTLTWHPATATAGVYRVEVEAGAAKQSVRVMMQP